MMTTSATLDEHGARAPEIYRCSPFEFVLTAEAAEDVVVWPGPVPAVRPLGVTGTRTYTRPLLPDWMTTEES